MLDEHVRWTGSFPLEELLEMMTNRDPAKLSPPSLERMIKEGNASQVTEMMLDKGNIFPAFVDLLTHEKMFVRLGAMVYVLGVSGSERIIRNLETILDGKYYAEVKEAAREALEKIR